MANAVKVREGVVEVSYAIYEYEMDDGSAVYDWVASNDEEPMELFLSIDEAEADARNRLGD